MTATAPTAPIASATAVIAPYDQYRDTVRPQWIDHNGHMNMGYYLVVFDCATAGFFDHCGLTRAHRKAQAVTTFCLEAHINYLAEACEGDGLAFRSWLLGFDEKRIHYIHEMRHAGDGRRLAVNELMSLHVGRKSRRAAPMHTDITARLSAMAAAQAAAGATPPPEAGRFIGLNNRRR